MATQETIETVANVVEAVEDTVETVERIPKLRLNGTTKKQQIIILSVTALAAGLVGGGVSHILTKRHVTAKFEQLMEDEVELTKKFYEDKEAKNKLKKEGAYSDPVALLEVVTDEVKEYTDTVEELKYQASNEFAAPPVSPENPLTVVEPEPVEVVEVKETVEVRNIFKDAKSANSYFDYEEEVAKRTPNKPYIITHDEFMNAERDYTQVTLTYFEGDDVLTDEQDAPVEDVEGTVGEQNLFRWGHGSKDNNIVYIRNERLELEFEVLRSNGDYAKEVLGFIEHSDRPGKQGVRKFRRDDG
jgi:hypothetical protein